MTVQRFRGNQLHEGARHLSRYADHEHFDTRVSRGLCLRGRSVCLDVGGTIGDQEDDPGHTGTGAVVGRKHIVTSSFERFRYVRVSADDVLPLDGPDHGRFAAVIAEVEPNVDLVAELEQTDLGVIRPDVVRPGDVAGEAEHLCEPILIVRSHDTSRLIQHNDYIGIVTTKRAASYCLHTTTYHRC